jgi:hypothetical protein
VPFITMVAAIAAQLDLVSDRVLLLWSLLASAVVCAVLVGFLQKWALRGRIDVGWLWVGATASGMVILWPLAIVVFHLATILPIPDWPQQWEEIAGWGWSIAWAVTGVAQYLVLKQQNVPRAGWWVLANASGAMVGIRLGSWISWLSSPSRWWPELMPDLYAPPRAWILGALVAVGAVAVCTGVALMGLLGRGQSRPTAGGSDGA